MRFARAILLAAMVMPVVAHAQYGTPAVDRIFLTTASGDTLRTRLGEFAATATNPRDAVMALYYRGESFERAARPDSAIACYRNALERAYRNPVRDALVDALLRRRAAGDVAEAVRVLEQGVDLEDDLEGRGDLRPAGADPARLGWAYVLSGQPARGLELLRPIEPRLAAEVEGRYRLARAYIESGDPSRAVDYLAELDIEARLQDPEIRELLASVEKRLGTGTRFRDRVTSDLKRRDDAEQVLLARMHGRRVTFRASDGALLGGVLVADSSARQASRAAIMLPAPGDDESDLDSLVAGLRGIGMTVLIVDPRGSGWSVAPEFALPDTWHGREDAIGTRVARDLHDAISACASLARIDTTGCLAIGVGHMASIVLAAARLDPRIAAVALIDPWINSLSRGAALADARAIQRPSFFQVPTSHAHFHASYAFFDTLYGSSPKGSSRWVDVLSFSRRARAFGSLPGVTPRFVRWVDETLPARRGRRSTEPRR